MNDSLFSHIHARDYATQADAFIDANPHVWARFIEAARAMAAKGQHFGMKGLVEWARWQWMLSTKDAQGWKLNNNHTAYLARRLMKDVPEVADLIETRRVGRVG